MDIDLTSPEVKAAIKAAVTEATDGLAAKNKELLGELKTARKGQEIKPETLEKLEDEIDSLKTDLAASQKEGKTFKKAAEDATTALETESGFTKKLLVDNGLTSELTKNGVTNAAHMKAATALLRSEIEVSVDGNERSAKVGDKSLADYVKEWASGEEGKNFVAADLNSGGGANGGRSVTGQKTMTRAAFDQLPPIDQSTFSKEGGSLTA